MEKVSILFSVDAYCIKTLENNKVDVIETMKVDGKCLKTRHLTTKSVEISKKYFTIN